MKATTQQEKQKKRQTFVHDHMMANKDWKNIIFSDKKRFNSDGPDGNDYQHMHIGEPVKYRLKRQAGGGSIMVWGCFVYNQLGPIVMIPSNLDGETYVSLLKKHFLLWYNNLEQNHYSFVQDNASPQKKNNDSGSE